MEGWNDPYSPTTGRKFFGKYRGIITDIDDPNSAGRIRVTVPTIHFRDPLTGEIPSTGWAIPFSARPVMRIPPVDAVVWVEFEAGDIERPIWSPGPFRYGNGVSEVDNNARGVYDTSDNKGGRADGFMPESQFEGTYTNVETWQAGGNKIMLDATPGKEAIEIIHNSGTRITVLDDGSVQIYSAGNVKQVIKGSEKTEVEGQSIKEVTGPTNNTFTGSYNESYNQGKTSVVVGDTEYTYDTKTETSTRIITQCVSSRSITVGGTNSIAVSGSQNTIITDTAQWVVANVFGVANPLSAAISMQALNGQIQLKAGPTGLIPGVDHSRLAVGLADIVMNAIARVSVSAPLVQLGPAPNEPVAKAVSMLDLVINHYHVGTAPANIAIPINPTSLTTAASTNVFTT